MTTLQKLTHIYREYKKISGLMKAFGQRPMRFYKYFPMKWEELKKC